MEDRKGVAAVGMEKEFRREMSAAGLSDVEVSLIWETGRTVELDVIWNHGEPGKGKGGDALRLLTEACDRHGVELTGYVHFLRYDTYHDDPGDPESDKRDARNEAYLGLRDLKAWYARHGFETVDAGDGDDDNITIRRIPRSPVPSPGM